MSFPNAYKGISRILSAQCIQLICSVLTIIGAVLAIVYSLNSTDYVTLTEISGTVVLIAMIFGIIAIIMNLVGISTARKDDSQFSTAFIFCVISLILGIAAGVIELINPTIADWISFVQKIASFAVIEHVVAGIISLATQLKDQEVADLARKIRTIISILYCVAIILSVIGNVDKSLTNIFSVADVILEMAVFIVYIVLLTKAKKMLA